MKNVNSDQAVTVGTVTAKDALEWRRWLRKNHQKAKAVWLVYYKVGSGLKSVTYNEALEEALCYGWIDSKVQRIDEKSYRQYFSKRKAKSVWSKVNKAKVHQLIAEGRMKEAGFRIIEEAKRNGYWASLDKVEQLIIPSEMEEQIMKHPGAEKFFRSLSRSAQRNFIQYIAAAKREDTRRKRSEFLAAEFANGVVPNQMKPKKN